MKVLQVHTRYRLTGGEDTVVRAEAELLRSAGHDVVEYHVENPSGAVAAARKLAAAPWNPASASAVRAVAAKAQPDVAHVHNTWFALSPSILSTLKSIGVPVVMTLHNYRIACANGLLFRDGRPCEDCVGTHPWHGVQHRCYRRSAVASAAAAATISYNRRRQTWLQDVDLFLTPSEFARQRVVAAGIPGERVVAKPHFVPDPGERPRPPSASREVLFVGRLSPEKGVDRLVQAWRGVADNTLDLVVLGDGPLLDELRAQADARVQFAGSTSAEAVHQRMLAARALVFPSQWYETFGMVVVEAMAAGMAVIVSDLGVVPEVTQDLPSQARVPHGDPEAWKQAIRWLADDEAVDDLGARARESYLIRFTAGQALESLLEAYRHASRAILRT